MAVPFVMTGASFWLVTWTVKFPSMDALLYPVLLHGWINLNLIHSPE